MSFSAFFWDLDGTLLDSYGVIVSSLCMAYRKFGVALDPDVVLWECIAGSMKQYLEKTEQETGVSYDSARDTHVGIEESRLHLIGLMPHARETLEALRERGARHFVITHRGSSSHVILKNNGILDLFEDIITAEDGFPRKPDPASLQFLMEKHGLDPAAAVYVGDRIMDVAFANRAGIQSILYVPEKSVAQPDGTETYLVRDLAEILTLA
ncbi:MAG: HAD-IA family hydrolase [Lachnospiraceae bacterium]|nr:HAD-IA family hydrolase [Lachnospiraceae bacterium]